jgi:putative oxidoreductase
MQYTLGNSVNIQKPAYTGVGRIQMLVRRLIDWMGYAAPLLDLGIRLFIANVFFKSGLTKIANWQSTLALFENEYAVPLLPSDVAAYLGTAVELGIPVLLVLGLGTRFAAIVLFVFNIVAAISYPDLSEAGRDQHMYWGMLILVTIFHGPGKISVDHFIRRKFGRE